MACVFIGGFILKFVFDKKIPHFYPLTGITLIYFPPILLRITRVSQKFLTQ